MTIRILIADDHGVLRAGLRAMLEAEPGIEVIGEAANGTDALQLADTLQPDMMLLDINMPRPGGIEITRQLQERSPQIRVLILTAYEEQSLLREAIQAGARGYVTKRAIKSELVNAIHAVWRGDLYVHSTLTQTLLQDLSPTLGEKPVEQLTPRETDVLRLIAQGYTNRQAAEKLSISVRTVETHRANLMAKLGLRGRMELVQYAIEQGLFEP